MKTSTTTSQPKINWRLKKNDMVRVLRGRDRGKKGKVLAVLPREGRIIVEGLNLVKKHVRAKRQNQKGQRVSIAAPLPIAGVQLICPQCKKAVRVGVTRANKQRQRVCKKCQAIID